ncbi:MAG TPA: ribosome maturation factor RimP [Thermoanaerobaculaceae bacterium]|nr:ribosome maturation factor RimP [Thermoanaerobaculaceae bacterium]HRS17526.1 ribosome maturation factor RimP [Thermoanaerobaculaceae bacterium]
MARLGEEVEDRLRRLATSEGLELCHVEIVGTVRRPTLRLVIDRESGGVTLDDCERVSRQASALLDAYDPFPGPFVLEVTSPGLDRKLYSEHDWERFAGQPVRIKMKPGWQGQKVIDGTLVERRGENAVIEALDGSTRLLPVNEMQEARLAPFGPAARAHARQGRKEQR